MKYQIEHNVSGRLDRCYQGSSIGVSYILHKKISEYFWQGESIGLSLKSVIGGRANYKIEGLAYRADDDSYILINQGQPYSVTIRSEVVIDALIIYFDNSLVEDVVRNFKVSWSDLLDEPRKSVSLTICQHQLPYDASVMSSIVQLRKGLPSKFNESGWLTEQLYNLAEILLSKQCVSLSPANALLGMRSTTRGELLKRLRAAQDFMIASIDQNIKIEDIAKVACLSTNHFLRSFKLAYGRTPHQYLTILRLNKAKDLLAKTDLPISEICELVGFESHGSFTTLFRRIIGMPPSDYRKVESRERKGY